MAQTTHRGLSLFHIRTLLVHQHLLGIFLSPFVGILFLFMKFVAQSAFVTLAVAQVVLGAFTEITKPPPGGPKCNPDGKAKCLDVQGAKFANGTPVQMFVVISVLWSYETSSYLSISYDCNRSNAQDWEFHEPGPTSIRLRNTNFCLDAGSSEFSSSPPLDKLTSLLKTPETAST